MTDERLEECRRWLKHSGETFGGGGRLVAARELLAEVDRLRADVAGYAALADALAEHGGEAAGWAGHGAARMLGECCRQLCADCRSGFPVESRHSTGWYHVDARGNVLCRCGASALRNLGPLAPPAPWERLASRVAALEAALRDALDYSDRVAHHGDYADRLKAARKTLEESP